jgi:hypothetical protein
VTINRWYNSLSPTETRRKVLEEAVETDFGILYYVDRRPPYRKQKAVIQRPLVCSSGCWDLGVNAGDALGGSSRRRLCENVLRYLIAIVNIEFWRSGTGEGSSGGRKRGVV